MAKILLVEDDQNLREIFEMRLQAEGYQTLTAGDGEEALVVAMKDKPDLVIADVMMPKLSGFEMLETLRAAPEMSDVKVVMMTALGQAEDRARGEKLGVVKYLVKSQVTLEDFVRVVREVLQPTQADAANPAAPATDSAPANQLATNNQGSETSMDDQSPTNPPATPTGDGSGMPTDPMGSPPAPSGDTGGGAMGTDEEKQQVDQKVDDWAASKPSTPPTGDDDAAGGAPSDPSAAPTDPPASMPGDTPSTTP